MSKCYHAMNVPSISNISQHTGYTSGGQNLTIHGHGFNDPNITVTVAGRECTVTQYQDTSVSCELQSTDAPSVASMNQSGAHGVRAKHYNDSSLDWNRFEDFTFNDTMFTQWEIPTNQDATRQGYQMYGYFAAPATAQYRFRMTCDDYCEFHMGLNASDPLDTTMLVSRYGWTSHRYHFVEGAKVSDWVNLTKGEEYYIYGRHLDGGGGDNYAVGVEINQTALGSTEIVPNHHHAMKELQYISVGPVDSKFETFRITVNLFDTNGFYIISFQNPSDLEWWNSGQIQVDASASNVRSNIRGYFTSKYGSDVAVNRTMYFANGTETTSSTDAATYVYHVVLSKLVAQPTTANVRVIKNSQSTITVDQPSSV
jgi:hypothetical protein